MLVKAVGITSEEVLPGSAGREATASSEAGSRRWLVLSGDGDTTRVVVEAVRRTGAACHVMHRGAVPSRCMFGRGYRYAFIDLVHPPGDGRGIDRWAAALRLHRCRLVVRAADGDLDGECWARERGAVVYLPGRLDAAGFGRLVMELGGPTPPQQPLPVRPPM